MNEVVLKFAEKNKNVLSGRILDVGSMNVNGSLRSVLTIDVGVDMREGPGVDEICNCTKLVDRFGPESFDCVASADMLEHCLKWDKCLENMWAVLKPNGYLFLTMAIKTKGRHAYPDDYWRFDMADFVGIFDGNRIIDTFTKHPSIGVIVQKQSTINTNIKPIKVQ